MTYFPVNWTDGMRISSKEFAAMENSIYDNLGDVRRMQLNEYCYGLLPSSNLEVDRYPKLKYSSVQSTITLLECRAITPGGHRIEIVENLHESLNVPEQLPTIHTSEHNNGIFEVFIKINPFERIGAGRYSDDVPPRYKSVCPRYELSLRPKSDNRLTSTEDILKISEIELRDGKLVVVLSESGNYIPPCVSVNAHKRLQDAHNKFGQAIENILNLIRLTREKNARYKETSDDVRDLLVLSDKVAFSFIGQIDYYQTVVPTLPPVYMILFFKGLARAISYALESHSFSGLEVKKEFERNGYFIKYKVLIDTIVDHSDIYTSLENLDEYVDVVEMCFSELNKREFRHIIIDVKDDRKEPVKELPYMNPQVVSDPSRVKDRKNARRF